MNIVVHYPKSADALARLEKRVAEAHIETVTAYIAVP